MNNKSTKNKLLAALLTLCMILPFTSSSVFAAGVNYIDSIHVAYTHINYKAGEAPRATAEVTRGNCTVAYEYWREIYQKEEGGVWSGTGRYWYSDPEKMASLAEEKQITQFEAGHHYSYNIVLTTEPGYFISEDETIVSVGDYEWGTADKHTNLEIKEMSTKLYIYSPYSIDIPEDSTDKVITSVSIIGVNQNLDASTPITFTAASATWCAGQYDITEEAWEAASPLQDIIKSTDAALRAPIAGGEYWYSIVLTAKDGYVFSKDFSDSRHQIKEGSEVIFLVGGFGYEGNFYVSDDGKTLTAWEFMDPVTVKDSTQSHVDEVVISGAKFDYQPGDAPQAGAKLPQPDDSDQYEIVYESWEEIDNGNPVAYWYSDANQYTSDMKKITQFEAGKTYVYSLALKTKEGYVFKADGSVMVNDVTIEAANVTLNADGNNMIIKNVKTITLQDSGEAPEYAVIEGADGMWTQKSDETLTFRANGEFSKFTGVEVDGNTLSADQYTAASGSTVVTLKNDYLATLSVGKHRLTVVYSDGECSADFEIKADTSHNHSYGTEWKYSETGHWHECECGAKADEAAHSYAWVIDKEATATEKGSKHEECTICGYKRAAVEIPATGPVPTPADPEAPQTGDTSGMLLWITLFFISGGAVTGTALVSRRKKYNR